MSVAYGEQQRNSSALSASGAGGQRELERQYHVVLQDSLGHPALGFREGTWFRLTVSGPQPLQLRGAIRTCPHAAGSIVQIACWWMRENPMQPRSLDLATELALTVGELVRVCPADGLGTTSMDLLPMAMAAVAQSGPPVAPAPALPSGSSGYAASSAGSSAFGSTPALGSSSSSVGSSDAFGSGPAFGSGAYGSGSGTYASSSDGLYGSASSASGSSSASGYGSGSNSSAGAYGQTSGYGSSSGYSSPSGSASSAGYSSTSSTSSTSATSAYGSSSTGAYSTSATSTDAYGSSASGYGTSGSSGGYSSSSSASGYEPNAYAALSDPLTDPLVQSTYSSSASTYTSTSDPLGQSAYANGTYAGSASYDTAPTSYIPAATGAAVTSNGWFEPADGTGTGGFPAVPPAPVMGRPAKPVPPAPVKPYSNGANPGTARGGYQGGATQQAALPPASRPRESGADWEPRAAAPRRPATGSTGSSHQPRPQQQPAAPRQVPGAGAGGQQPRPRPQQPRDGYGRPVEPPQDLGRSSDRNGAVPPRRPAAAAPQQRGTMGQRPASRPRRPSER